MSRIIFLLIILGISIFIWDLAIKIFAVPEYIFPSPLSIVNVYLTEFPLLLSNLMITAEEAIIGFLIANMISISLVTTIFYAKKAENIIVPLAVTLKTIPIIALTPLLILWFGSGLPSRIATAALICFFPALVNLLRGIKSVDNDLLDLFKIYNSPKYTLLRLLLIPSTLPYLFSSLKISSSLAVVGALVGEFIGSNKGLGFLILTNYYTSDTAMVFAAVILSSLLGIFLYYILHYFENRKITWTSPID